MHERKFCFDSAAAPAERRALTYQKQIDTYIQYFKLQIKGTPSKYRAAILGEEMMFTKVTRRRLLKNFGVAGAGKSR
jgi:hypothetical protein